MEVFQKILVKLVHTTVIEEKDLAEVVQEYLMAYKLMGKCPYELMFNRKMQTKLPQLEVKNNEELDQMVREKNKKEAKEIS